MGIKKFPVNLMQKPYLRKLKKIKIKKKLKIHRIETRLTYSYDTMKKLRMEEKNK
jgi:hypothetical protein